MNIVQRLLGAEAGDVEGALIAIETEDRRISYAELRAGVARGVAGLRARGVGPADTVVLACTDTPELVMAFLAVLASGAVGVIVSTRFGPDELAVVAAENAPRLVVHDDFTRELSGCCPELAARPHVDASALLAENGSERAIEIVARDASHPALRIYSSGTTGQVKGITHHHKDFSRALGYHREVLGVGPGRRVLCTSKLPFAYALVTGLLAPLALRATLCLHPGWLDPAGVARLIERFRPHAVYSTPSLYRALLDAHGAAATLAAVENYASAGEHLSPELFERWRRATGRAIHDCYGCSEAPFFILATPAGGAPPGSAGRAAPGAELRLVDGDGGSVATGEIGHLWIRHDFLAAGYASRREAWAERIHDDWFDTGDLYRIDADGYWFHCGREDSLTKVAGQWVSLPEIEETAVAGGLLGEAAATLHPDKDGLQRVALLVVPRDGVEVAALDERVRRCLDEQLPRWKRPKWIFPVATLPRTHTGKIQRYRLPGLVEAALGDG